MQYIVLIGDNNLTLDAIKSVEHYGSIKRYEVPEIEGRYCVDYGKEHIFYDFESGVEQDYEKEDLQKIPFSEPHFIMMVYSSEKYMKRVLQQNNFLKGIYVDNDHGLILPLEEYIRLGMPVE
jgi:hypothetical protein